MNRTFVRWESDELRQRLGGVARDRDDVIDELRVGDGDVGVDVAGRGIEDEEVTGPFDALVVNEIGNGPHRYLFLTRQSNGWTRLPPLRFSP